MALGPTQKLDVVIGEAMFEKRSAKLLSKEKHGQNHCYHLSKGFNIDNHRREKWFVPYFI